MVYEVRRSFFFFLFDFLHLVYCASCSITVSLFKIFHNTHDAVFNINTIVCVCVCVFNLRCSFYFINKKKKKKEIDHVFDFVDGPLSLTPPFLRHHRGYAFHCATTIRAYYKFYC